MDCFADTRIRAATTIIFLHGHVDLVICWFRIGFQHMRDRHELARYANTALAHVFIDESLLNWMQTIRSKPFDRGDLGAGTFTNGLLARIYQLTIHMYAANAAFADAATVFSASQPQSVAEYP